MRGSLTGWLWLLGPWFAAGTILPNLNDGSGQQCTPTYGRTQLSGTWEYLGSFQTDSSPYNPYFVCDTSGACLKAIGSNTYYCQRCVGGQYCPMGTVFVDQGNVSQNLCAPGYYCPDAAVQTACPAGNFCPEGSYSTTVCRDSGWSCLETSAAEGLCEAGYYCPTSAQKYICPSGSYCPLGSAEPQPCGTEWVYVCEEGATTRSLADDFMIWKIGVAVMVIVAIVFLDYRKGFARLMKNCTPVYKPPQAGERALLTGDRYAVHQGGPLRAQPRMRRDTSGSPAVPNDAPRADCFRLSFQLYDLGLQVSDTKMVLKQTTATIEAGTTVALMGPSGAGKTTLLNVLCGRAFYGSAVGQLTINGVEAPISSIMSHVGFVPQDDIVHSDLTVFENLYFSAKMRLNRDTSEDELQRVLRDTLQLLQLEHVQDTRVGDAQTRGISGGQRKRVNIGLELVAQPSVLFLDEPTSGLDSTTSMAVMGSLKKLSQTGVTVISVFHQPRPAVFLEFDSVMLMCQGSPVYVGDVNGMVPYMQSKGFNLPKNENPADWVMDCISGTGSNNVPSTEELIAMWQECVTQDKPNTTGDWDGDLNIPNVERPKWEVEFNITLRRDLLRRKGKISEYSFFLLVFVAAACVVGGATGDIGSAQNPQDTLMFTFVNLLTCAATVGTFSENKMIFWREVSSGYSTSTFFLSQNLLDAPLICAYIACFGVLYVYFCTPLANIEIVLATMLLMGFSSSGMAYAFAVILDNPMLPLVSVCLVLNIILSGTFQSLALSKDLNLPYFISPSRYGIEMITVSSYNRWASSTFPGVIIQHMAWSGYSPGNDHWSLWWTLVLQGIAWRFIACCGLYLCNRGQMAKRNVFVEVGDQVVTFCGLRNLHRKCTQGYCQCCCATKNTSASASVMPEGTDIDPAATANPGGTRGKPRSRRGSKGTTKGDTK